MFGNRYSLNNHNPIVYCDKAADAVEDTVSDGWDYVEDTVSSGYDAVENAVSSGWDSVNQAVIQPWYDPIEAAVAAEAARIEAQIAAEAKRLEERAAAEFDRWEADVARSFDEIERWGEDFNKFIDDAARWTSNFGKGLEYLTKEAFKGNFEAIAYIAVLVISVVITLMTAGGAAPLAKGVASYIGIMMGIAAGSPILYGVYMTVYILGTLSWMYGVYNLAMMFDGIADLGRMLKNGGMSAIPKIVKQLEKIKDKINLSFTTSMFNGQLSMWMAGGDLYDSMKAGDVSFKPDGNLNSQVFLGLPNTNSGTKFSRYQNGSIGDYVSSKFNNMAGDPFFSGTKLVA